MKSVEVAESDDDEDDDSDKDDDSDDKEDDDAGSSENLVQVQLLPSGKTSRAVRRIVKKEVA